MIKFEGVYTALVTPFKDGQVDFTSFRRLIQAQKDQGIDGFVINGTTAESPTLKLEEVKKLFEAAREELEPRTRLLIGTGSNSTLKTVEMTRTVQDWKPDGVLVVVPYYNRPPQRGMIAHFKEVAKVSQAPVVLYNVPGRTVASMDAPTVAELSQVDGIVAIKEASGDLNLLTKLKASCRPGFGFLSGDDGSAVEFAFNGGQGVIAVASHIIGREMKAAITSAIAKNRDSVLEYHETYSELFKWLYCEANPIPVKMALHWMGLIDSPELRLPLVELDPKFHKDLKACLKSLRKI